MAQYYIFKAGQQLMMRWWKGAMLAALLAGSGAGGARREGLKVGAKAPAVVINDLDGKPVDLAQYIGRKPYMLEFWATWCSVCEELLPKVKAAHAAYGAKVEFLGVNVTVNQTKERVRRYLERARPAVPHALRRAGRRGPRRTTCRSRRTS